MSVSHHALSEPPQRPRFGPLREVPPDEVLDAFPGDPSGATWVAERFGADGGYPNGGIWQMTAHHAGGNGSRPFRVWVKRTSAHHLGDSHVWRCRSAPDDPQWWGREATFYQSSLATTGWPNDVRVARCYAVDDHDDCRDLWLESVDLPASPATCARAGAGLARWQVAHLGTTQPWLSHDWIPTHLRRHGLDNDRTLAHPGWGVALDRGLDPVVRHAVAARVTDPAEVRRRLRVFPQTTTHYDLHAENVGTVGDEVVLIDWAFVGMGPIGHDVGHLALDLAANPGVSPADTWHALGSAYCSALAAAGWTGDPEIVWRSMAASNVLRLGWAIDHVLGVAAQVSDEVFATMASRLQFVAELQRSLGDS